MALPNDQALTALIDLVFDHACAQPARSYVDPEAVLHAAATAATPERLTRLQDRFLLPLRTRVLDRMAESSIKIGAWLPESARSALDAMLSRPTPLPKKWIEQAVGSEQVRENTRTMMQETLTNFVNKALNPTETKESSGGGLRGALGFGARVVGAAGKSLLGGLGSEIQKQLQDRARDLVDSSVANVQARIVEKLTSEETARQLAKRRQKMFASALEKTEADLAKTLRKAPFAQTDPLVPQVVHHNAHREELRVAVLEQMRAVLDTLGNQTLGALLDEYGLRDAARAALHTHGLPLGQSLVQTDGFKAWWDKHTTTA